MRYGDFLARYRRAYDAWSVGDLDGVGATEEIGRLRELVASIEEPDRHAFADAQLDQWTRQLAPGSQDRLARAASALARATRPATTEPGPAVTEAGADTLGRARQGVAEIVAIADETGDESERAAILAMTEPLVTLIAVLEEHR